MVKYRPFYDLRYLASFGRSIRGTEWRLIEDAAGERFLSRSHTFPRDAGSVGFLACFIASLWIAAAIGGAFPGLANIVVLAVFVFSMPVCWILFYTLIRVVFQSTHCIIYPQAYPLHRKVKIAKYFSVFSTAGMFRRKNITLQEFLQSKHIEGRDISNAATAIWFPVYSVSAKASLDTTLRFGIAQLSSVQRVGYCLIVNYALSDNHSNMLEEAYSCIVLQAWPSREAALISEDYKNLISTLSEFARVEDIALGVVFSQSSDDSHKWVSDIVCDHELSF